MTFADKMLKVSAGFVASFSDSFSMKFFFFYRQRARVAREEEEEGWWRSWLAGERERLERDFADDKALL